MDPTSLATVALNASLPWLTSLAGEVSKDAAGSVGKSIWGWAKSKLTSPASKEALDDFERQPNDLDNRKAAEAALSKFLKADANAAAELAKLIERLGVPGTSLAANTTGDNNVTNQIVGSSNKVSGYGGSR